MNYDRRQILAKFGAEYVADERTFVMGIDTRLTAHMAERFKNKTVLETCTGAGFSTIALARVARRVITVEISQQHHEQALKNINLAGVSDLVNCIVGDIMDPRLWASLPEVDTAFLDPDWAVTGEDHIYRFVDSNTKPPADGLLNKVLPKTPNVALVLSPMVAPGELEQLPEHERESLFINEEHALFCLYFGDLVRTPGISTYSV